MSRHYLASYVRHLVRSDRERRGSRSPAEIEVVEVFRVDHRCLSPQEARAGWEFTDLRVHRAYDLGDYRTDGSRRDGTDEVIPVDMAELAARIIRDEVAPAVAEGQDRRTRQTHLAAIGIPHPIARLVIRAPHLAGDPQDDLPQRVWEAVEGPWPQGSLAETLRGAPSPK